MGGVTIAVSTNLDKHSGHYIIRGIASNLKASRIGTMKLELPVSQQIVRVRMVDTSCTLTIKSKSFVDPTLPGQESLEVPDNSFLIEHEGSGQKLMFDLGIRKDYWNLPPVVLGRLSTGIAIPSLRVDRDVSEILVENSVPLEEICM